MAKINQENSVTDELVEFSRKTEKIAGENKGEFIKFVNRNLSQLHNKFLKKEEILEEVISKASPFYQDDMD